MTGVIHIKATFNNTIITLTDINGNVIKWISGGILGFKGARRSTSYAAQAAASQISQMCYLKGFRKVYIFVRGIGDGKEAALRGLQLSGLDIISINDVTPIPHNGCRAPKARRV